MLAIGRQSKERPHVYQDFAARRRQPRRTGAAAGGVRPKLEPGLLEPGLLEPGLWRWRRLQPRLGRWLRLLRLSAIPRREAAHPRRDPRGSQRRLARPRRGGRLLSPTALRPSP